MLCINNPHTEPYFNLAAEEYLLKNFSEDIFMLYQNEPSVVVGKYQHAPTEANLDFAKENNIKLARRISGGGAVFHDKGNLNLVFIENNPLPDFKKTTAQILEFLSTLGIQAKADERFSIKIEELKISGSAQYVYKNRALYHATLLYSTNLEMLNSVLDSRYQAPVATKTFVKSVKSPVTNLMHYLPDSLDISDFKKNAFNYFLEKNPQNKIYSFNEQDSKEVENLKTDKYSTPEWIFKV